MVLFDRDDVLGALEELARRLAARGAPAHIRVVGGAAIAVQYGREALTQDVDALFGRSDDVLEIAAEIARERGWPNSWLNDDVAMHASHFDHEAVWVRIVDVESVQVDLAPADLLLAMKLKAGRGGRDEDDIDLLCDACGLRSAAEAEAIFERFYPEGEIKPLARRQLDGRAWLT